MKRYQFTTGERFKGSKPRAVDGARFRSAPDRIFGGGKKKILTTEGTENTETKQDGGR